jgi:hypothetical protein
VRRARECDNELPPHISADIFTLTVTAGPDLEPFIKRDGAALVCPDLKKRYPPSAA